MPNINSQIRSIGNGFLITTKAGEEFFEAELEDALYRLSLDVIDPQKLKQSVEQNDGIGNQIDDLVPNLEREINKSGDGNKYIQFNVEGKLPNIDCYVCGQPLRKKYKTKLIDNEMRKVHHTCGKKSLTTCIICGKGLRDGRGIPVNNRGEAHKKCLMDKGRGESDKLVWGDMSRDKLIQAGIELIEMQNQ